MSDAELIARLRASGRHPMMDNNCKADVFLVNDAADRIETLVKEKEQLGREVNMARYGQPDFAWSIHEDAMADLEAKLAKAVERLTNLEKSASEVSRYGAATGPQWTKMSIAILAARATLAELTGNTP